MALKTKRVTVTDEKVKVQALIARAQAAEAALSAAEYAMDSLNSHTDSFAK